MEEEKINIVINNPSVRGDADIVELTNQIVRVMRPLLLNTKIAYV